MNRPEDRIAHRRDGFGCLIPLNNSKPRFASVIWIALSSLMLAASLPVSAQDSQQQNTDAAEPGLIELLFVQHAASATLENGKLTLEGIGNSVLYFSDRPDRIAGHEPLSRFIDMWDQGDPSFAVVPPNAVLTVFRDDRPLDLVVILKEPVLNGDSLEYSVEVLDGPASGSAEKVALFIDGIGVGPGIGSPGSPGLPGVHGVGSPGSPGLPGTRRGRGGSRNIH